MRKASRRKSEERRPAGGGEARTGVGTPGPEARAGGAALGGDTGDVGTPRNEIGGSRGGTHGATATPEGSTVWQHRHEENTLRARRRRARGED